MKEDTIKKITEILQELDEQDLQLVLWFADELQKEDQ